MSFGVEVHLLTWNEEMILPYALRHYGTFATRICVHDAGSTDRTREIIAASQAELWEWDTGNQFNDLAAMNLKNRAWRGTDARWVIMADADEFYYFPQGAAEMLAQFDRAGVCVVKPRGWEMLSETLPTTAGQIYDEIRMGARDDHWYAKPILFSAERVQSIEFGAGAHSCQYTRFDGRRFGFQPESFSNPETLLLHFHQIGPIERIARIYDERRERLSEINVARGWGNFKPGMEHALEKRNFILAGLQVVNL